jgi:hypothetical protein
MSNEEKATINKFLRELAKLEGKFIEEEDDMHVRYISVRDILTIANKMVKELKE